MSDWKKLLEALLQAAGDLDGSQPPVACALPPMHSAKPRPYDKVPRRDDRFPDPYNMGVNAEVFLYDPQFRARDKTLMMFYKRLREIDVPEMMASIITETPGQAVGLLPRHDAPALGRGAPRHDGRGRLRRARASTGRGW